MKKNTKLLLAGLLVLLVAVVLAGRFQKGPLTSLGNLPFNRGADLPNTEVTVKPAFPPQAMKITKVDSVYVYLDGDRGTLRLTNDPAKLQIVKRVNGQLTPASSSDLRADMEVTVVSLIPGVKSQIIIE